MVHCIYPEVTGYNFQVKIVFLSLKIVFALANSVNPDEMPLMWHFILCGISSGSSLFAKYIYSTTKETHQSLLGPIMEIRIKKQKYIYTIFCSIQFCIISLNSTVLLKSVHVVCHCLDKGSFSKMTSFSLENEYLVLV